MYRGDRFARQLAAERNGRNIACIVILAFVFVLFMGISVMALLAELGVVHDTSYPRGAKTFVIAVVCLAICAALAALAVHFEHRLRGHPPGRLESELSYASGRVSGRLGMPRYPGYRRYGPTSMLTSGIIFMLAGGFAVWGAFASQADSSKSSYTQRSGTPDSATVRSVANNYGRTKNWANVAVTLQAPVGGQRLSVLYVPSSVSYQAGQVISVLVDPADPGYSELPGTPYTTGSDVAGIVIGAAACLAIGVIGIISFVRTRKRMRVRHPRPAAGTAAVP